MAGRILLISAWCCTVVGCGNSGSNSTRSSSAVSKEDGTKTVDPSTDLAKMTEAKTAVTEFVNQAKAGKLTADSITDDFKKVIGEPLTPSEREKGFSDSSATDWLKLVGPRLQSANIVGVSNAMGYFVLDSGTLRMVNTDSKWRIDWFHVGRPKDAAAITADESAKRFTIATFLDPLFTHNWELSEAALSIAAKKSLAPALGNDPMGYNRGTLRGKLKDVLNGATGYNVAVAGDKVIVTLTGAVERKIFLTLIPGTRPDVWVVNGVEMP